MPFQQDRPEDEISKDIGERGRAIYEDRIRPLMREADLDKYMVINVDTGEYVLDADDVTAFKLGVARFPDAPRFALRVGHEAMYYMGWRFTYGALS